VAYIRPNDREACDAFNLGFGDVIVSLDRPIISTGLKAVRVRESDMPCLLVQRIGRLRFVDQAVSPDYVSYG